MQPSIKSWQRNLKKKDILTQAEWKQKTKAKVETAAKATQTFRELESQQGSQRDCHL
jgi:hypothetical protein